MPEIGPDQLAFSVTNMDRRVDPGVDFYRYASGGWLDRVERPERLAAIGAFQFMAERLKAQMVRTINEAAEKAATSPQGSPVQQVGDFYNSYMDVAAIDAAGMEPLRPELERIGAIASLGDLSEYLGRYTLVTSDFALLSIVPSTDRADTTRTVFYVVSGKLGLLQGSLYEEKDDSRQIQAYLVFLRDILKIAGHRPAEAARLADLTLDLERAFHAAKITPVEAVDPRNSYNPQPFATLQAEIPELDLARLLKGLGAEVPETLALTEPRYLPALSQMLRNRPLVDFKDYLKVKLILKFQPYLTTAFDEPVRAVNATLAGVSVLPPREERAQDLMRENLGQPVSRLYVENYFKEETRAKATDMVQRIHAAFLERIKTRSWLSEPTRQAAIDKLEKLSFNIAYPDPWIDYSGVAIGPRNVVANIMNLIAFDTKREIDKAGKPVVHDAFSDTHSTLPIIINAAYDSSINGFEVPAAMLQPAAFEADRDAAVYFCRLGAVLGHEMTHGFDSGGRLFDATGNLRDWWAPQDAAAFEKEAHKLIDQANGFEVLPGLKANGPLNVKENMADVGGINFAYQALQTYLSEHPADNVEIDGMTPAQRCFVAWAQMWTLKANEQTLRYLVAADTHAPGNYRAFAALQHVEAFYEAFDIEEGDPMWLAPEKRVNAW
ncbi:M13 family metallopeptidase [Aminobacter carboxidus]|uniref:M13 family metallopeptidase n=1 Tax=Aminobacter carboxidus TaxID=376165 RepID=A0ABR9GXD8_9HYPH|nr:M13 family metallopeptidase [Aminobacter carboxidus]